MRISRVHVGVKLVVGEEILLDRAQGHYLQHVLRLNSGAAVVLFNGREAIDYPAILRFEGKQVKARIDAATPTDTESSVDSEIIQGLGRADHIDWTIQKTTELGVNHISLFNAERTQHPLKPPQLEKKLSHWRAISTSACAQCGRAILPTIQFHANLEQVINAVKHDFRLLLAFDGTPFAAVLKPPPQSFSILLGPEGGLSQNENSALLGAGFQAANLGPRVLRTETAAVAALSIAQSIVGDFS